MGITQASMSQEINQFLVSGSDITAAQLRQVLQDMTTAMFQSGITGFGPPVNLIGLGPVAQGQLTTALQSDCVLAINQAIAPTWTGVHIFNNLTSSNSFSNGAVVIAGGVGIAQQLYTGSTINAGATVYCAGAPVEAGQRVTGSVSGTVATTNISMTIEAGATLVGVDVFTTTGFLASGSVNFAAGSGVGDVSYIAAMNVKSLGRVSMTFANTLVQNLASMPSQSPNFFISLTQTGTPSAVGQCVIAVRYLLL